MGAVSSTAAAMAGSSRFRTTRSRSTPLESAGGVFDGDATMRLINTIIAQNLSAVNGNPDVDGISLNDIVDVGNNFIGNNFGTDGFLIAGAPNAHGSFVGTSAAPLDPLLGPLSL